VAPIIWEGRLYIDNSGSDIDQRSGQGEVGAWYIKIGQRGKGEAQLTKAFERNADEIWHYVHAGEGLLGVSAT
jgi:hypothetical protein